MGRHRSWAAHGFHRENFRELAARRRSLGVPRSRGFYRFFMFELLLTLVGQMLLRTSAVRNVSAQLADKCAACPGRSSCIIVVAPI